MFSELASPGKSIVSSYIGLCLLKQEPSVTNGEGGEGGVVVGYTGKKTQTGRKVLTGKLKELTFLRPVLNKTISLIP